MEYAEILQPKFAYATIGYGIVEPEYITGMQQSLNPFPSPADLWDRLRSAEVLANDKLAEDLLSPFSREQRNPNGAIKTPRYFQEIAIHRAAQAVPQGVPRIFITMTTGTGRTCVAFQIVRTLWRLNSSGGSSVMWTEPPGRSGLAHVSKPATSSFHLAES